MGGFATLALGLAVGQLYWPVFASLHGQPSAWVELGGLAYTWLLTTALFFANLPCRNQLQRDPVSKAFHPRFAVGMRLSELAAGLFVCPGVEMASHYEPSSRRRMHHSTAMASQMPKAKELLRRCKAIPMLNSLCPM